LVSTGTLSGYGSGGFYVASSFDEYAALQADGVALEMLVLDPVFRIRD
jgi:hypothetical protein